MVLGYGHSLTHAGHMSKRGPAVRRGLQAELVTYLFECAQGRAAYALIWVPAVNNIIPPRSSVELSLRALENAQE